MTNDTPKYKTELDTKLGECYGDYIKAGGDTDVLRIAKEKNQLSDNAPYGVAVAKQGRKLQEYAEGFVSADFREDLSNYGGCVANSTQKLNGGSGESIR